MSIVSVQLEGETFRGKLREEEEKLKALMEASGEQLEGEGLEEEGRGRELAKQLTVVSYLQVRPRQSTIAHQCVCVCVTGALTCRMLSSSWTSSVSTFPLLCKYWGQRSHPMFWKQLTFFPNVPLLGYLLLNPEFKGHLVWCGLVMPLYVKQFWMYTCSCIWTLKRRCVCV